MRKFDDLLHSVIYKKNLGYTRHTFRNKVDNRRFYTNSLNITNEDISIAKNILKIISVNNEEDLFLGLSCVTLISSVAKRIEANLAPNISNSFTKECLYGCKKYVTTLIDYALQKNLDFSFCFGKDESGNDITYVELAGVQFSFHKTNSKEIADFAKEKGYKQYKDLDWNHSFAFQNGAKEAFQYALHLKNLSPLKIINEKPLDYANSVYNENYDLKDTFEMK